MKNPSIHHADLIPLYPEGYDSKNNPCVAKPFSYNAPSGLFNRLKLALQVFSGQADIVIFKAAETEEEFKKTPRYVSWKRKNK
jgi:hypothetical protein